MSYYTKISDHPTQDNVIVGQMISENDNAKQIGYNVSGDNWANFFHKKFKQPITTSLYDPKDVTENGRRIHIDEGGLSNDGYWSGGKAIVYRISNGEMSKIRSSDIVDQAASLFRHRHSFIGTSARVPFQGFEKENANQWFAVRAYDEDNNIGPLSNVVNLVTPEEWSNDRTGATDTAIRSHELTSQINNALSAPVISANWAADGTDLLDVSVDTESTGSPVGYILYISDYAPENMRGSFIELADDGGVPVRMGDLVVATVKIKNPSPDMVVNRVYGAGSGGFVTLPFGADTGYGQQWRTDDPNNKFRWGDENSETFAEYEITAPDSDSYVTLAKFSGDGHNGYYPMPKNGDVWLFDIDVRALSNTNLRFYIDKWDQYGATITEINGQPVNEGFPYDLPIGTSRQTHTIKINWDTRIPDTQINRLTMSFEEVATVQTFHWALYDGNSNYLGLTPDNKTRVESAKPGFIRDHSIVKKASPGNAYDLRELIVSYLHASLQNTVDVGSPAFWLQPELWDSDEYVGLADYLCGDGSDEWSALRISMGRTAPWTDDLFIMFELSNETWNSMADFYNMRKMVDVDDGGRVYEGHGGESYGMITEIFYQSLVSQAATYNAENRFMHIVGGRFNSIYGDTAARYAPSATMVARAPYMRGWEVGSDGVTESPQAFQETLDWPATETLARLSDSDVWIADAIAGGANPNLTAGTYEDAVSFSNLPPNIPESEKRFAKTKVAATAYLDKIAVQSSKYEIQAHFTLNYGDSWSSHDPITGKAWPYQLWLEVFNEHCAGAKKVSVDVAVSRKPSVSVGGETFNNVPEIGCHVYKTSSGWSIILINRNIPFDSIESSDPLYNSSDNGTRSVKVSIPVSEALSVSRYRMPGAYDSQNYDNTLSTYDDFEIVSEDGSSDFIEGSLNVNIPAAEAWVYTITE